MKRSQLSAYVGGAGMFFILSVYVTDVYMVYTEWPPLFVDHCDKLAMFDETKCTRR